MELAPHVIHACYRTRRVICVSSAAAAAVEFGEAVGAFAVRIYIAAFEFIAYRCVRDAVVDISEQKLLVSDELMTWIQVA